MYWQSAPNQRDLRTEDWLNDACENAITANERVSGDPELVALMSPKRVEFKYPKEPWGFPLTLLLTPSNLVLGRKKAFGKRPEVIKFRRYDFIEFAVGDHPIGYYCLMVHGQLGDVRVVFHTPNAARFLADYCASG